MRTVVVTLLIALSSLASGCGPKVGPPRVLEVKRTTENLERGKYLANHVTGCVACHAERDWSRFAGPPVAGTEGAGGDAFTRDMGFPGDFYSPNITPAALSSWTDGELERAITAGVSKDGTALFPVMPYLKVGKMCQDDVDSIIAYVRSLDSKQSNVPARDVGFPFSMILNGMPKEQPRSPCPDPSDGVKHGEYLANAAGCMDCHSQAERGELIAGKEWSGGREFPLPNGTVRSANITPDAATGIGGWTKETFVARFAAHRGEPTPVGPNDMQTVMPWRAFAGMSDDDLGALFDYLKSLPAKPNQVERWTLKTPSGA